MVLNQVGDGMNRPVDRTAVVIGAAEILHGGFFLIAGDMYRMLHQLMNAFVFTG